MHQNSLSSPHFGIWFLVLDSRENQKVDEVILCESTARFQSYFTLFGIESLYLLIYLLVIWDFGLFFQLLILLSFSRHHMCFKVTFCTVYCLSIYYKNWTHRKSWTLDLLAHLLR